MHTPPFSPALSLTTARLRIRAMRVEDAAFVRDLLNDPDWLRFIGDRGVRTEADALVAIRERYLAAYARDGHGLMIVERATDSMPMGMCGLIRRPGLDDVDIGFAYLPAYRGLGYAFEAAQAVLGQARNLAIARVVGISDPDNLASITLMERLGMRFERRVRLTPDAKELVLYAIDLGQSD